MTTIASQVFSRSVLFAYETRLFSVTRDADTSKTRGTDDTRWSKTVQVVIDPKKLQPFGKFKQAAFRAVRSSCTKLSLLNLWITDPQSEETVWNSLLAVQKEWQAHAESELFPNYSEWVREWAKQHQSQSADIISLAPSLEQVKSNTRFLFTKFRLAPEQVQSMNLDDELATLPEQALTEIAQELRDSGTAESKRFTQSVRGVLTRVARKAQSLGYLHPRLLELSEVIHQVLPKLPHAGPINDLDAQIVHALIDPLQNPKKFLTEGFGTATSMLTAPALQIALPAATPSPAMARPAPAASAPPSPARAPKNVDRVIRQADDLAAAAVRSLNSGGIDNSDSPVPDEMRTPSNRPTSTATAWADM